MARDLSRRTLLRVFGTAAAGGAAALALPGRAGADVTAAAVRKGIDYSWGRPRPSAVVAAGYTFVCRYVSWSTSGKNLTRSEANALRAAGLDIVTNWEYEPSEALDGYNAGARNATEAHRQAVACGMPADRPIYFSVDFDPTSGQQSAINSYFDGVASVIGRARTGAYGGYGAIDRLFDAGKIRWGWQTYAWSGGNWDSRAKLRQVQNGITVDGADCDRNEAHAADFGQWGGGPNGTASIYGVLSDGRLTYTAVNAATGERTHGAVVSTATLGFQPVAMATLNFNTVLATSPAGQLYRIDVITNNESLVFNAPVALGGGWTHRLLAFDGKGHLYGIAGSMLRRYNITAAKPGPTNITGSTIADSGFTLKTLTATGPDWLLGTTDEGQLISYRINGAGDWDRHELRSSTWQVFDLMLSPGGGVYFGHKANGALLRYVDTNPFDGADSDLSNAMVVDDGGWSQVLLSAQPNTVT
jgi:hypothetical protein